MSAARPCLFASDLHGQIPRYEALFGAVASRSPRALFLGGDLLPAFGGAAAGGDDFLRDFLGKRLQELRDRLGANYPRVFVIFGNDDPRREEAPLRALERAGLLRYLHNRSDTLDDLTVYGYACVPPTPFLLKDWERYDVSRHVPPGCVSPEEGRHSVLIAEHVLRHATIQEDLARLAGADDLARALLLLHSPPYETRLDRAALDGKNVDHVPLDVHVGSIAIRRFIETKQPLLTLHGHVHESVRLTGTWRERLGRTWMFSAAHDGPELALVSFDPDDLDAAARELL
jgi:uncharacterized protein